MMKYCVIGNIAMQHYDNNGIIRYGTASFPGGRKVYISRRLWGDEVTVLGLNRFKSRYTIESIPLAWIENIRFSKTFDPEILELMVNTDEFPDMWWRFKEEDKLGAKKYAQTLIKVKEGDMQALEEYNREVMEQYY